MRALIIRDLLNLKYDAKSMLFAMFIFVFVTFTTKKFELLGFFITFLGISLIFSMFSADEKVDWNKYSLVIPATRKDVVLTRYAISFLVVFISFIIMVGFKLLIGSEGIKDFILLSFGLLGGGLIYLAISLPVLFKCGAGKGRIAITALTLMPMVGIYVFVFVSNSKGIKIADFSQINFEFVLAAFFAIALVLYVLSSYVSILIYNKKDL